MTEHVGVARRERTPSRTGERNGSYGRDLIMPVGKTEQQLTELGIPYEAGAEQTAARLNRRGGVKALPRRL